MPDGGRRARNIYEVAREFRERLLRGEGEAVRQLSREYARAWERLRGELDAVLTAIEAARGDPARSLRIERERIPRLMESIAREMGRFADVAADVITERQAEAVRMAREYVQLQLEPVLGGRLGLVYADAVEQMAGFASDGSPLRELLDALGPEASEATRRELIQGIILGRNPRETAEAIQRAAGMGLTRALRIARTETLRAYREATRQHFIANQDVVRGWIWWSARDARTCIACIAMHGTEHGLDEVLDDHPQGRCTMLAIVHGARGRLTPEVQTGEAWFEGLGEAKQREYLGRRGYEAYETLQVDLRDFVGRRESARWGSMRYRLSVADAIDGSGMPRVRWVAAPGESWEVGPTRRAIRFLRDNVRADMSGVEMVMAGRSGDAYAALVNDGGAWSIEVYGDIRHWRTDLDAHVANLRKALGDDVVNALAFPRSDDDVYRSALTHEFGHWLTVERLGRDYLEMDEFELGEALGYNLFDTIAAHLELSGHDVDSYNVGEVIAEDFRMVAGAQPEGHNYMTLFHDLGNPDEAVARREMVWRWMTEGERGGYGEIE